ncbi:MAG: molybdate ABC transporter substrate-binding protein [Spirochaetia bacterium]|jgi:molybdate transport system substrate-binding protein|nr:molybdate ABC transporter substrate-binding protein [Spirochaetia bacterium]
MKSLFKTASRQDAAVRSVHTMRKKCVALILLCAAFFALSCSKKASPKLYIFAAASTTDAVNELIEKYKQTENPKFEFATSYASSGDLAKQIVDGGADANIFISANTEWVKYLEDKGKAEPGTKFLFGKNSIVIVTPKKNEALFNNPKDLASMEGKLAMGDPKHVPAGQYGRDALTYYGVFDALTKGKKIAYYSDVRQTLNAVELEQADYGIVYKTDAVKSTKVAIIYEFPAESHKSVEYPACAVSGNSTPEAKNFLDFMQSETGREIITKYGF